MQIMRMMSTTMVTMSGDGGDVMGVAFGWQRHHLFYLLHDKHIAFDWKSTTFKNNSGKKETLAN